MIKIYGASDDLVEIEGHPDGDEVGCWDEAVTITIGDHTGGLIVRMEYAPKWHPGAVWVASIGPIDEEIPIPWPVEVILEQSRKYSALVLIDAPGTVKLSWKKGKRP